MIRHTLVAFGFIMLLPACGVGLDTADSTPRQSSATVAHGSADAAAEQRANDALQKRYRFDGPTKIILSRPLTSSEVSDLPCGSYCASRSYYVLILEGAFLRLTDPTAVSTVVPSGPYRFVGVIIDSSSGRAVEFFGSSSASDVRAKFSDADVD
jgi:hypothetical protein